MYNNLQQSKGDPMKYLHVFLCSFSILTLSACGGGSSSDGDSTFEPTDPNTVFQTFPAGYFTEGRSSTQNCTGSDTAGGVFTAAFSEQTQAQNNS